MSANHDNDYKFQYKALKRKLKVLIYENEFFQEELRKAQRSLLRVQRDKSFLLDRILLYQPGPDSSTDSDETEDSDNEGSNKDAINKRKKGNNESGSSFQLNLSSSSKSSNSKKRKTINQNTPVIVTKSEAQLFRNSGKLNSTASPNSVSSKSSASPKIKSGHHMNLGASGSGLHQTPIGNLTLNSVNEIQMSREEIERQLAARQPITDFPTTVSLTLPNQLFSDNLLEGDFIDNDIDTSPSNLEDDVTIDNFD